MVAGAAMVAYPATYGDTGVMTFIVNSAGQALRERTSARTPPRSLRR
jgi:hypothetical protein